MFRRLLSVSVAVYAATVVAGPIQPLYDINRTVSVSSGPAPVALGSQWLLTVCAGNSCMPGVTDGTPGGTHPLLPPPTFYYGNGQTTVYAAAQGVGYFDGLSGNARVLYRTDGTAAGTSIVGGVTLASLYSPVSLVALGGNIVYAGSDGGLWKTDGTAGGTTKLATFNAVEQLVKDGPIAFFVATDPTHGAELWRTDGSSAGTALVRDIMPGPYGSGIRGLTAVNGRAFFWASGGPFNPFTLWTSDGTEAGTQELSPDLAPDAMSPLVEMGGKAYAVVRDYPTGTTGLVQSDGTSAGTSVLATWSQPSYSSSPLSIVVAGGKLYFFGGDGYNNQVWTSDGTVAGTTGVTSSPANNASALISTGTAVYFMQYNGGSKTYRLDPATNAITALDAAYTPVNALGGRAILTLGTASYLNDGVTTVALTTAAGETNNSSSCAAGSAILGSIAIFAADDGQHGCELWSTDGTPGGTRMLADTVPGLGSGLVGALNGTVDLVRAGNLVYFLAGTMSGAYDLWQTDGTPAGTQVAIPASGLRQVYRLVGGAGPYAYVVGAVGNQPTLFRSDGASMTAVRTFTSSESVPTAYNSASFAGAFYFVVNDYNGSTTTLYRADGTGVTQLLRENAYYYVNTLTPGSTRLYLYLSSYSSYSGALYRTDGTPAGTAKLSLPSLGSNGPLGPLGALGDTLYFVAAPAGYTYNYQQTVWRTDGTDTGTAGPLGPLWAGQVSGTAAGNYFYLYGTDSTYTGRLLRLAGSTVADVTPPGYGGLTNAPASFAAVGDAAWFFSTSYYATSTGTELWTTYGPGTTAIVQDYAPGTLNIVGYQAPRIMQLPSGLVFFGSAGTGLDEPLVMAFDTTPDAVTFSAQTGVSSNSFAVSVPVQVTGITRPVQVMATNGQFCVSSVNNCSCDVAGYASTGVVGNGEYLCVKQPTASSPGTSTTTYVTIAGTTSTFVTTTAPPRHLDVLLAGTGSGRVASVSTGIACGTTCGADYAQGTTVTLEAVRTPGSTFAGWSGACSGIGPCTISMSADRSVTANFTSVGRRVTQLDLDGDGRGDLLWSNPTQGAGAWTMNGTTQIQVGGLAPPVAGGQVAFVGDFDGDGRTDLLWRSPSGRYDLWLMAGLRVVSAMTLYDGDTSWQVVATADLDGDGKTDLIWRHTSGVYGAWLMNGASVAATGSLPQSATGATLAKIGDFDGDGKSDILWIRTDGTYDISLMNGLALKSPSQAVLAGGSGWTAWQIGDFDGDGRTDLVWKSADGSYGIWLLNGTSIKAAQVVLGPGSGWNVTAVGDLDGDGKSDLLWTGADGTVGAWLMNGVATASAPAILLPAHSGWSIAYVRDYDGDGKDDITWRYTDGQYGLWLMNGLAAKSYASILAGGTGWEAGP